MTREKRVPFLVPQAGESTGYIRGSSGLGQNADGVVYKNEVEFRVKVVQELLRHGSSRVTLDIYAQAQMPAKRAAQQKVVAMVRMPTTLPEPKTGT
jgi:hypothetical protein